MAQLTLRALAARMVHPSQCRDRGWYKRLSAAFDILEREDRRRDIERRLQFNLALISSGQLDENSYRQRQEAALDLIDDAWRLDSPWAAAADKATRQSQKEQFEKQYEELVADGTIRPLTEEDFATFDRQRQQDAA